MTTVTFVTFPGERDLRAERLAFVETIRSLTDEEFESAPTLCEGWAPRDVLAHMVGIEDGLLTYVAELARVNRANERIVAESRGRSRAELTERAVAWAEHPALSSRLAAYGLLGDVSVHHQDVLKPLGRTRDLPRATRLAILREGVVLGGRKLLGHRVVPTDVGRPLGRGREVRGTAEALGMWLCGRMAYAPELSWT